MSSNVVVPARLAAACAIALLGACASFPPPTQRLASAEAASRGAREVGVDAVPQAALHAKLADEQIQKAKVAMQNGDNKAADRLLLRAQADAELALALAREGAARAEVQQVSQSRSPTASAR